MELLRESGGFSFANKGPWIVCNHLLPQQEQVTDGPRAFVIQMEVAMKEIPLTQDKVALVDDADYDWLMQYKWAAHHRSGRWYAIRAKRKNGKQKQYHMHREIMKCPDDMVVHHVDNNGLNNTRNNLQICTQQENLSERDPKSLRKYRYVYDYKEKCWIRLLNRRN